MLWGGQLVAFDCQHLCSFDAKVNNSFKKLVMGCSDHMGCGIVSDHIGCGMVAGVTVLLGWHFDFCLAITLIMILGVREGRKGKCYMGLC